MTGWDHSTGSAPGRPDRMVRLTRTLSYHRRVLAAALVAGAVGSALLVLAPPKPPSSAVLAAARDLPAGTLVSPADVTVLRLPPGAVPDGAYRPGDQLDGLLTAGPIGRGEVLTDLRFLGPTLLEWLAAADASGDELVAVPVRLADPGVAQLVQAGQLVDVLAAAAPSFDPLVGTAMPAVGTRARVVASGVRVLSVPRPADDSLLAGPVGADGTLVVVATTAETAAELAGAAVAGQLSVVIRARPSPTS